MRSTRCIGKNKVGKPMRSPSGSITWRIKSSKEFKSMPRIVTPAELMDVSAPHNFSLGLCRLRMMIEFGSKVSMLILAAMRLYLRTDGVALYGSQNPKQKHTDSTVCGKNHSVVIPNKVRNPSRRKFPEKEGFLGRS